MTLSRKVEKVLDMSLTSIEFASIMEDRSKLIEGNITWVEDEDHSPAWVFRANIESTAGWPLFVQGRYNPLARTLTYVLILKTAGRIYGLDLGKDHHNPQCNQIGEKYKHTWSEQHRDKEAYEPDDITAQVSDPVEVWQQFCKEAGIEHDGKLRKPPPMQMEMFDEY